MSPRTPRTAFALAVAALLFALTGCMKIDAQLTVGADDTVSGTIVMGVDKRLAGLTGQTEDQLVASMGLDTAKLPTGATVEKYADDGFVGRKIVFSGTPLKDFTGTGDKDTFSIVHSGHEYVFNGVVNLSLVQLDNPAVKPFADMFGVTFAVTFPGKVIEHNGELNGRTVTWKPKAGQSYAMRARAEEPTSTAWILPVVLSGVGVLAVVAIVLVVLAGRRRRVRAGDGSQVAEKADATLAEPDTSDPWAATEARRPEENAEQAPQGAPVGTDRDRTGIVTQARPDEPTQPAV
ncbi:LppM family (lipo)protein [Hamadaea tsunoensis]|uniref:LppM family (lipo)protein n=1 Tax=Hamadaea tsunoensis TaxID=53368 RepID=UPI0012FA704F|nr:hypothetical protein [Hamadaea tsunoensis]